MSTQPAAISVEWTLGDRLRRIRRSVHMTQDEFAATLGVGGKAYAAWEADRNYPEHVIDLARHVQAVFGVPASWLLGIDENPRPVGPDGGGNIVSFGRRARRYSKPQPSDPKVGGSPHHVRVAA